MDAILQKIVTGTEAFLTWRARRRWKKKQKQKQKNVVLDWVEAFVWSAFVVLLVNQYAFQAYEIPSQSMESTLLVHDRIFVNKFVFGPELIPGMFKVPGLETPERGNIIIFENPDYLSQGPVFDVAQRLIYMMTLSLVDIDRDADGRPKAHFLIKRAVGYGGDVVRFRQGYAQFKPAGIKDWIDEDTSKKAFGLDYANRRLGKEYFDEFYKILPAAERADAYRMMGLPVSDADKSAAETRDALYRRVNTDATENRGAYLLDSKEKERLNLKAWLQVFPNDTDKAAKFQQLENGTYIPEGWLLPLGDNRDNSQDGRFFGPVRSEKILGEAAFRYWPLGRFGEIR